MSADNYYLVRKHPTRSTPEQGIYVALMGFMSEEVQPEVDPTYLGYTLFEYPENALASVLNEYAEYGHSIHPECYESQPVLEPPEEEEAPDLTEALRKLLNTYSAEDNSGTPDYILADYLMTCLEAFDVALRQRAIWRGESVELPALLKLGGSYMTPDEVVRQHDYPTSDPQRPLGEIIDGSLGRVHSVSLDLEAGPPGTGIVSVDGEPYA